MVANATAGRSRVRALITTFGLTGLTLAISACSVLNTFNTLVPKDGGSIRVASALPYAAGPRRKLDVYTPRNATAGLAGMPVVVFFYGGSWSSGNRSGYGFVGRALAAQGFVVIIPDYRLVPEVTYPGFVEDGAAAVRWAQAHAADYGGDPARIVLAGHSAGAYIAAMLAIDDRWLGADRSRIKGLVGLAGPYDFAPFDISVTKAAFGAWPKPEDTQPVNLVRPGDPPALLAYGDRATTVLPRNSVALASRLRADAVPVTTMAYPGLGHVGIAKAIAKPFRGEAPVLADIAAFVRSVCR